MPSLKPLKGVAYDIAHHAQSGLSWLHPHMSQACRHADILTADLELFSADPYPKSIPRLKPLELALLALRERFQTILDRKDLPRDAVQSVRLEFGFSQPRSDDYWCSVRSVITTSDGRVYQGFVDSSL